MQKYPFEEEYPVRMTLRQASDPKILNMSYKTLVNKRSRGMLPFDTHRDGMKIYIFTKDVIAHLESFKSAVKDSQ